MSIIATKQIRRRWRLVALFLLAFLFLGALALLVPDGPISFSSYQKVRLGMSQEIALAAIGLPPGNYAKARHPYQKEDCAGGGPETERLMWVDGDAMIVVCLDQEKKVSAMGYWESRDSLKARLRSWLASVGIRF